MISIYPLAGHGTVCIYCIYIHITTLGDLATRMQPAEESSPFLRSVRDAIRLRHYSIRTEAAAVHWIKRFILFHGKRHPMEMGESEVAAFLNQLALDRKVVSAT
jgi:hypothetical protein